MWSIIKKAVNSDLSTPLNVLIDSVKTIANTINTNVGSNANAASATGSLHAKVKDVKNNMTTQLVTLQKPRRSVIGKAASVGYTAGTVLLNVSGKGCLKELSFRHKYQVPPRTHGFKRAFKITVDGIAYNTVVIDHPQGTYGNYHFFILDNNLFGASNFGLEPGQDINLNFLTSLKIEVATGSAGTNTGDLIWHYELE